MKNYFIKKIIKIIVFIFVLTGFSLHLKANKITVSNVSFTGKNTTDGYVMVQFDLSWENAWRTSSTPYNWDAAWVFVKYRVSAANGGDNLWKTAYLNNTGHNAGSGTSATFEPTLLSPGVAFNTTTNPAIGVFIFRSSDGTGTFGITGAQIRWNYAVTGVTNTDVPEIRLVAIEMVNVPQGPFAAGSGGTESNAFTLTTINAADATKPPTGTGNLGGAAGGYPSGQTAPAATWPNGYNASYVMKYEISQQQYVDFLNMLTYTQQSNRVGGTPSDAAGTYTNNQFRHKIKIKTPGIASTRAAEYETGNPYVACNFLSWMDGAAYADWAGLRPMTELEYEKSCRGVAVPVANEFAWGSTAIGTTAFTLSNSGAAGENISSGFNSTDGNAGYVTTAQNSGGPLRVGIFAANPLNAGRLTAGASYWGIMELSGNLSEMNVTIGNSNGRVFSGAHGNGSLSAGGNADVLNWPGMSSGEVTLADGTGIRGGSWYDQADNLRVSNRAQATSSNAIRNGNSGFRAARSVINNCGDYFILVNHVAGAVAPVNKTVTYGTVTNIPGESFKCWITRNLGAGSQATDVSDASEAAAGWYWQFNRKQGYKHDGVTLTPAWSTISITESSDWITANDPCTIEIGTGWRVPTNTEWNNVDNTGNWGNWNGSWNSGLKLHAAGEIGSGNGSLWDRGSNGFYWSSTQNNSSSGNSLFFFNYYCSTSDYSKTYGHTLRCLRNLLPTLTTTSATSITATSASTGGDITDDGGSAVTARGVCWSTSTGPTIALSTKTTDGSGTGSFTSSITGLSYNTYYVRAYATSARGTSYGNEVSFTTPFSCGTSTLAISHMTSDGIAPVNKDVIYSTVTNIPGETTKCWITKNLGASQQATAVSDNTEASAGWYWQFNRKQGYKHDGVTLTPAWSITSIDESSDWLTANDPCAIELGTGWRVPTSTEWTNVDGASGGNWTDWNGPWNSALKLHAAGYLDNSNGSLGDRGSESIYWSSTQYSTDNGLYLSFNSGFSGMFFSSKAFGFSVRCIRNLLPTLTTTSAISITETSASSGGNITDDGGSSVTARGVCWSTTTSPTVALSTKTTDGNGMGSFTSSLTNLTSNTTYYIRAYATSANGTAYGDEQSFTTLTPFVCGTSAITVNHLASGGVAPVNKTVTYSTVTNIPGEASKCWITKNLGADIQADSVNAKMEIKAGWYWQFNRKKGFMHDGVTLTPAWSITAISESSDWITDNDPCAIELGTGWRIPTDTEWLNVDNIGNWLNWYDPWNSALKLHAAGFLNNYTGALTSRGSVGTYWSSWQNNLTTSSVLVFTTLGSNMNSPTKARGCSVRCIRD